MKALSKRKFDGQVISEVRTHYNLTQKELAHLIDASAICVYLYEKGKCKPQPRSAYLLGFFHLGVKLGLTIKEVKNLIND